MGCRDIIAHHYFDVDAEEVLNAPYMNKIETKLKENRNRRSREQFLASLNNDFKEVLLKAEFCSDEKCLEYAAFSTWDHVNYD